MRAKKVFEKFEEDSDPIQDLGIGLSSKITNQHLEDISILFSEDNFPGIDLFQEYPWLNDFRKNEPQIFNYLVDLEKSGDLFFGPYLDYNNLEKIDVILDEYENEFTYNYKINVAGGDGTIIVFSNVEFPRVKNYM